MENKNLYNLKPGDRFYFAADQRRHVWQVDHLEEEPHPYLFRRMRTRYYLVDDAKLKKEETVNLAVVYVRTV